MADGKSFQDRITVHLAVPSGDHTAQVCSILSMCAQGGRSFSALALSCSTEAHQLEKLSCSECLTHLPSGDWGALFLFGSCFSISLLHNSLSGLQAASVSGSSYVCASVLGSPLEHSRKLHSPQSTRPALKENFLCPLGLNLEPVPYLVLILSTKHQFRVIF